MNHKYFFPVSLPCPVSLVLVMYAIIQLIAVDIVYRFNKDFGFVELYFEVLVLIFLY